MLCRKAGIDGTSLWIKAASKSKRLGVKGSPKTKGRQRQRQSLSDQVAEKASALQAPKETCWVVFKAGSGFGLNPGWFHPCSMSPVHRVLP